MKYLEEFRDPQLARKLLDDIQQLLLDTLIAALTFNRYMFDLIMENIIAYAENESFFAGYGIWGRLASRWELEKIQDISLLDLEKRKREVEVGDGSPQTFLVERLGKIT